MNAEEHSEYQISLWGPSSSGKTSLMNALTRALYERSKRDEYFDYLLYDANTEELFHDYMRLFQDSFRDEPTKEPVTQCWVFQRRVKEINKTLKPFSVHTHLIQIHDMRGIDTVELQDGVTRSIFANSKFVLILLDPTLMQTDNVWGAPSISKEKYMEDVDRLLRFLATSRPGEKRWLAACVAKVDLLGYKREPDWIIRNYFGGALLDLIRGCVNGGWEVETFAVSSVGYIHNNGRNESNFNKDTFTLIEPDNWKPENVESPFFWVFNAIEQLRLSQHDSWLSRFLFANRQRVPYVYNRY